MTQDEAEEDAMLRFLLQDKDCPGGERCPDCSSPEMQVKRDYDWDIEWALCDDCGYSLVTSNHFPPRDLGELPEAIREHYETS